jgi:[protein-PII] uridylyltransferase
MPDGAERPAVDLSRFAPGLVATCEEYRVQHRARLVKMTEDGEPGPVVTAAHARILDGLLGAFFCAADAATRVTGARTVSADKPGKVALVAVGGFGRRSVSLHSDVDVLVLTDGTDEEGAQLLAEAFLYPLWDSGIDVGHSVQSLEAVVTLARTDLRTATMLLDARVIAGDRGLAAELHKQARARVFDPGRRELLEKLAEERSVRHERFGGSRYLLEPDIKSASGGLRDLDVLLWTLGLCFGARSLDEAVTQGALVHREADEVQKARAFLLGVRERLHLRAGRRQDRLTFEDQEELAPKLGFGDLTQSESGGLAADLPVERFMQVYYQGARTIDLATERMLAGALSKHEPKANDPGVRDPETRVGDSTRRRRPAEEIEPGILSHEVSGRPHLTLVDSSALERDPALALRLYRQVARRREPPYPFARDAITRAAADPRWCERLRATVEAGPIFLELLECRADLGTGFGRGVPVRRGSMLGELHEVGLLLAMIPEFAPLTGRVQHDVYHVYTVDVHSIAAIDRLRALRRGELIGELPRATRLAADLTEAELLYLGVLLHDVGKGRGGEHSEKGAQLAGPIAERLGLSPPDVAHVVWLVRAHLRLYHWAMRRDTSDPDTAREMASEVGTLERLRDLYLLTVVDLGTTNPNALTTWKSHLLDGALGDAEAALSDQGERESVPPRADMLRAAIEQALLGTPRSGAFLSGMPERYITTTAPREAPFHAEVWNRVLEDSKLRGESALPVAELRVEDGRELADLVVVARDRPGLLADIAAILASHRLAIVTANIHTRTDRDVAFDVFSVRKAAIDAGPPDADAALRVTRDLVELERGTVSAAELLARRPKPPAWSQRKSPAVRTEILVHDDASTDFTVLDIFTRDRVGLLHVIAKTLHLEGLSIGLSKVSTEGERVADVFYVVDQASRKKIDKERAARLESALRLAIARLDEP